MGDKAVLLETGQHREAIYNTADKYEEEDIEDQIRASKKKDSRKYHRFHKGISTMTSMSRLGRRKTQRSSCGPK